MYLTGARGQSNNGDVTYDASGTISSGGTAQLLLPARRSTGFLQIQNISDTAMFIKFGAARLTATLTSGVITSISIGDGGFGFTVPPLIEPMGGGQDPFWGYAFVGCGQPGYPSPVAGSNNVASAHPARLKAVLTSGAISAVTIEDGGSGYKTAPYLHVYNSQLDPNGCAMASATSGIQLAANGGATTFNGTFCPVDAISIFCATSSKAFTCIWAP